MINASHASTPLPILQRRCAHTCPALDAVNVFRRAGSGWAHLGPLRDRHGKPIAINGLALSALDGKLPLRVPVVIGGQERHGIRALGLIKLPASSAFFEPDFRGVGRPSDPMGSG